MVREALVGSYGTKSIAVMPFKNMSSDPEQEYFADGLTEELLNLLVQIQDLRVISRTSAFALKGQNLSVPEIGERLNVAHVLEGSVRKSGNEIRITAQLIDAATDTHLWSETYDHELADIFDIQDEIASKVVHGLKPDLLNNVPKSLRTDPVVLTLVMQARRAGMLGDSDSKERAIAAAPGNETILSFASEFARLIGKFDASLALKRLANERNPECHRCRNFWLAYLDAQRYDEAIAARLAFTGDNVSYYGVVLAALLKGDAELALEYAQPENVNPNYLHAWRAMALHSLGRIDEARAELEIQARDWAEKDPVATAMATLWLGDEEGALDLLYDRYWPHTHNFYREIFKPVWIPLHDNPRWTALREQSGWTEESLSAVQFDPLLLEVAGQAALTE